MAVVTRLARSSIFPKRSCGTDGVGMVEEESSIYLYIFACLAHLSGKRELVPSLRTHAFASLSRRLRAGVIKFRPLCGLGLASEITPLFIRRFLRRYLLPCFRSARRLRQPSPRGLPFCGVSSASILPCFASAGRAGGPPLHNLNRRRRLLWARRLWPLLFRGAGRSARFRASLLPRARW